MPKEQVKEQEPKEKTISDELMTRMSQAMSSSLFGEKSGKEETQEAVTPAPKEESSTEQVTTEAPVQEQPEDWTESVSKAVEKGFEKVAKSRENKEATEKTQEAAPTEEIPSAYKEDWKVIEKMASLMPDKYKNLPGRMKEFFKAELEYINQWKKDNRGQKFNPQDPDHETFYQDNTPEYDEKDFQRAQIRLDVEQAAEEKAAPYKKELEEIKRERAVEKLSGKIREENFNVFRSVAETVKQGLSESASSKSKWEEAASTDPIATDAVAYTAQQVAPLVTEVVKFFDSEGAIQIDLNNPIHEKILDIADQLEKNMLTMSKAERKSSDGREFATRSEFMDMSPEDQARHWFVGRDEIILGITQGAAAHAAKFVESRKQELDRYAKAMGMTRREAQDHMGRGQENRGTTMPSKPPGRPVSSPAAPPSEKVVTSRNQEPPPPKNPRDILGTKLFGRP